MAYSQDPADGRAHLIREMARSSERSFGHGSAASSSGSIGDDALQYGQNDTISQELPAPSGNNIYVDSAAYQRAFPGFSGAYSEEDEEEDSVEFGRGYKSSVKAPSARSIRSAEVSQNLSIMSGDGGRYDITGTPPLRPRDNMVRQSSILKNNTRISSMKENINPRSKTTDFVGHSTRTSKKVLGQDMHARVESDDTGSLSDQRPAAIISSARNTRFDRRSKHDADFTGTMDFGKGSALRNGTITNQTMIAPDMPGLTELVSGVRKDGSPIWTQSAKAASRFGTPSQRRKPSTLKQSHLPISSVPIPVDEKALFASLQVLEQKFIALEKDKNAAEEKLEQYELENLQLKSELEEHKHRDSDSALGTDIEEGRRKEWQGEKTQLESRLRNVEHKLDLANRKLTTSEVTIATMTNDRDAAHRQLANAFLNSEELKNESTAVQRDLADVQQEFNKSTRSYQSRIARLTSQEAELRGKVARREKAVKEMSSLAKQLWETRNALAANRSDPKEVRSKMDLAEAKQQIMDLDANSMAIDAFASTAPGSCLTSRLASAANEGARGIQRQRSISRGRHASHAARFAPEVVEATTDLNVELPKARNAELTIDSTYLSFMDGNEVAMLRQIVDEDRAKLADCGGVDHEPTRQHTLNDNLTQKSNVDLRLPRKSSMKAVSYQVDDQTRDVHRDAAARGHVREHASYDDESMHGDDTTHRSISPERQDTQRSIASHRSQRRARGEGLQAEMTSAYIMPDITLPQITPVIPSTSTQATHGSKQTTVVTRPIPVSDRMPLAAPGDEEHTVRPAQSPGLALATVLKGLESELQQFRQQLQEQETLYHQHDPSLSQHQRKIVYARIQKLMSIIDTKADQIYALYDVLEGQKAMGQMMKEEEVEVTLHNIGIDMACARRAAENVPQGVVDDSEADLEDDDDLSWKGIDATRTQTLPSMRGVRAY